MLVNAGIMKADGTVLKKDKDIRGGEIVMGDDGTPTGFLKEQAGTYTRSFLDTERLYPVNVAKIVIPKIQEHLLAEGYTMYIDGWGNYFFNDNFFKAAQQMDQEGKMNFVLGLTYEIESWMNVDEELKKAVDVQKLAQTLYGRYGGRRYRIRGATLSRRTPGPCQLDGRGTDRYHPQDECKRSVDAYPHHG